MGRVTDSLAVDHARKSQRRQPHRMCRLFLLRLHVCCSRQHLQPVQRTLREQEAFLSMNPVRSHDCAGHSLLQCRISAAAKFVRSFRTMWHPGLRDRHYRQGGERLKDSAPEVCPKKTQYLSAARIAASHLHECQFVRDGTLFS